MTSQDLKQIETLLDNKLDEKLDQKLKNFATKDDLKNLAKKGDLKSFATKDDLKNLATKNDLQNVEKEIGRRIEESKNGIISYVSNVPDEIMVAVGESLVFKKHHSALAKRVEKLEKKAQSV